MAGPPAATRVTRLVPFAIVLVVGLGTGYEMAYSASRPGLLAGLSLVFGFIGIGLVSLVLLIIATVAERQPAGVGQARTMRAGVGVFVLGSIVGTVLTPALGLGYRAPVVLEAHGTSNLDLVGLADFTASRDALTGCESAPGARTVSGVQVDAAGLFRGARVLVSLAFDTPGLPPRISIGLGGESAPAGAGPVVWDGPVLEPPAAELAGRATFAKLAIASFDKGEPAGSAIIEQPATHDPSIGTWPALSGTFTWSCGDYTTGPNGDLGGAEATPIAAHIDVELAGVDWVSLPAGATCDGSAVSGTAGTLQGAPFMVQLDLGKAVVGGTIQIAIAMDLQGAKDLPSGLQFAPNWQGEATVTELGPASRKGEVTFVTLPTGVDPASGPAPTGWPTIITGSMTWDCGPA
jgi:hypothetical protein